MSQTDRKVRRIIEAYFGESLDEAVYAALKPVSLRGGDWLFRQGDPGDSLYFLVRGRLQVWANVPSSSEPQTLLGEVLPGDSVGEAGLLNGSARSAGIRANRDSLLIQLNAADFQQLAIKHPALVMRLASHVASLMQRNISGQGGGQRGFSTITLFALHESQSLVAARDELAQTLASSKGVCVLEPSALQSMGAPSSHSTIHDELPEALKQWLSEQENEFSMVVYLCAARDDAWTRFAIRQADMVVYMADAAQPAGLTALEQGLLEADVKPAGQVALVLNHARPEILGSQQWLEPRELDFHLHLRPDQPSDRERVVRILSGRGIGLVLGAGAVRGLSELGVFKAMCELGVPVDWVGGSSIGSIVGAAIAHDWSPEKATAVAREAFVKGKPFSDYTLPVVSLIRGKRMIRLLREQVDVNIEDLPVPFFCVSSILDRGEVHVHRSGPVVEALRASAALPGVLPPAVVDSQLVVDGAVLNNLPVDIMQKQPVKRIIAVDVSVRGERKVDYPEIPSAWAVLCGRFLPFSRKQRVPSMATLILRSTEIGTLLQAQERGRRADLLINPPVRQFGLTDVRSFDQVVDAGYQRAKEQLSNWLEDKGPL